MNSEVLGHLVGFLVGIITLIAILVFDLRAGGGDTLAKHVLLFPLWAWVFIMALMQAIKAINKDYRSIPSFRILVFIGCAFSGYSWLALVIAGYIYL